jgi:predicted RNase H-like nuclease (RuvC/YqgF family)
MEEEIIEATDKQLEEFKRIPVLFSDASRIFFYRVNEKNKLSGIKNGDVVIIDRNAQCSKNEVRIYLDTYEKRYILTRQEMPTKKYWGKAIWILKTIGSNLD